MLIRSRSGIIVFSFQRTKQGKNKELEDDFIQNKWCFKKQSEALHLGKKAAGKCNLLI